jgi:hypothetical protein
MDLVSTAKRSKPNPASESPFKHSQNLPLRIFVLLWLLILIILLHLLR